jgi:hypothetical protein
MMIGERQPGRYARDSTSILRLLPCLNSMTLNVLRVL